MNADETIATLGLERHPEGGWFRQTHHDEASTAIWFLLKAQERSHWHRVLGSSEIWHFYGGDPLDLSVRRGSGVVTERLGPDLAAGDRPQLVVPPDAWQSAAPIDHGAHGYSLVGCTVAPPFDFANFELAPAGWAP